MIRSFLRRQIDRFSQHYDYDTSYMDDLLSHSLPAFIKFALFQRMGAHREDIPAGPWFAASLRGILAGDCGPCVQLVSRMAMEAGLSQEKVRAILAADLAALDGDTALVLRFTERVLTHDPAADDLRPEVVARWGERGLISLGFAMSSSQVYPILKYALGYGHACSRVQIGQDSVVPQRQLDWEMAT